MQLGGLAGRVKVVRGRPAETGVQHADIDGALVGRAELGQQAFGRVLLGEADAMHRDIKPAAAKDDRLCAPGEDLDRFRKRQLPRDARLGVMIAANDENRDPRLVQPPQLVGEKAGGLHRRLLAVVKVAGDHERVDLLRKAEVDDRNESLARRPANEAGKLRLAQRQRAQGRVEVDVGGMNESERHGFSSASR